MNTLYLGLDPSHFSEPGTLFHYPVIEIRPKNTEEVLPYFQILNAYTHFLFTSKTTVDLFFNLLAQEKISVPKEATYIAIGPVTKEHLLQRGVDPLLAPEATQEGVIELMKEIDPAHLRLFLPRSSLARKKLTQFLKENNFDFVSVPLYDTVYVKPEKTIPWEKINRIAFTSPSTVEGFFRIHSDIPKHVRIWCQGPITKKKYCEKKNKQLVSLSFQ